MTGRWYTVTQAGVTMIDGTSEATVTDGPVEAAPEPSVADTPAIDMDAVADATDAHATAVNTAHENFKTRMAAAYAELGNDLRKAYTVWDNAYSAAKSAAGVISDLEGADNANRDSTTAR